MIQCKENSCTVRNCVPNRSLLAHYHQCRDQSCLICAPVRAIRNASISAAPQNQSGHERPEGESQPPPYKKMRTESKPRPLPDISILSEGSSAVYSMTKSQIRNHIRGLRLSTPFFTPLKLKTFLSPLLESLMKAEHGWVFNKPVDPVQLDIPDYFEIIKEPMDLGTIQKKLNAGTYLVPEEFFKDVKLTFENAITYNSDESEIGKVSREYLNIFLREYNIIDRVFKTERARLMSEDLSECDPESSSCSICRGENFTFDPQVFYCNGRCKHKIRRNAFFYTDESNKLHFCTTCYAELPNTQHIVEGIICSKKKLRKAKNDDVSEEPWVMCDTPGCEEWTHQICALFNGRRNESADLKFICPKCVLFYLEHTKNDGPLVESNQKAKNLIENEFSKFVEKRCKDIIVQERKKKADALKVDIKEIPEVPEITLRVVSSIDVICKVKPLFSKLFKSTPFPKEFPYK